MQSYGEKHLIPNFFAFISPTYSDNSPIRRQTALTTSKLVALKESSVIIWCFQELSLLLHQFAEMNEPVILYIVIVLTPIVLGFGLYWVNEGKKEERIKNKRR